MSIALGKALTVALLVLPAAGLCFAGFRMARRGWGAFLAALFFAALWFVVALTCVRDPHIGKSTARGFPLWYPIGYTAAVAPILAAAVGLCRRRI
jgi:hypothetical protein